MSSFLRISQCQDSGESLVEVCDVEPSNISAEQMMEQLTRIFPDRCGDIVRGAVVVDYFVDDDELEGDPLVISATEGEWLCGTFFKLPRRHWRKLKVDL